MQHYQKLFLVAMVTVAIETIIIPKMQASSSLALQSVSRIEMRVLYLNELLEMT